MVEIDKITYQINDNNRYRTQIAKTQIVVGVGLRKDHNYIIRQQNKDYGKNKKWNTYTISREGLIYQHYDPKYHADFLGIKEADKKSISIILENMGCLFKVSDEKYINWLNEECEVNNVVERLWLGYNYWENITDKQLISFSELCKFLCDIFNIPMTTMEFHHYHKETIKFRGIVFRSNYIENSSDVNPFLDISKINELLHKE